MMFRSFFIRSNVFSIFLIPFLLILSVIISVLCLLGAIAFSTVYERKTIAVLQNRRGPNRAGWFGLLQAIGDGVKLVTKAQISKKQSSLWFYYFAPFSALFLSWYLAYFMLFAAFDDYSLYFLLIWTSLNVYSLPIAGIVTSHSRFALLGGIRSFAQLLSYELGLSVLFLVIVVYTGTPILGSIFEFQRSTTSLFYSMLPVFFIWFVIILAETNRVPFDLPEAEAELVAGFGTEYSGFSFAAFFLAEYGSMISYSYLTSLLFFYNYSTSLMTTLLFFLFVWTRTTLPRYRVDQLLWIGWYCFVPLTLLLYVLYYFRFNFIGFFSFSPLLMLLDFKKPLSTKYNIVNQKAFMVLHKKNKLYTKHSNFLNNFSAIRVNSLSHEFSYSSKTWLFLPLFNVFFSYYQLLCSAHGIYYVTLLNT